MPSPDLGTADGAPAAAVDEIQQQAAVHTHSFLMRPQCYGHFSRSLSVLVMLSSLRKVVGVLHRV